MAMDRFSDSKTILMRFTGNHQARASTSAFPVVFQPGVGRAVFSCENPVFLPFQEYTPTPSVKRLHDGSFNFLGETVRFVHV